MGEEDNFLKGERSTCKQVGGRSDERDGLELPVRETLQGCEEERYHGAVRVDDEPPPPVRYDAYESDTEAGKKERDWRIGVGTGTVEGGKSNIETGKKGIEEMGEESCAGVCKRGVVERNVSRGKGKADDKCFGKGVFKAVGNAGNRRTRRRKGRRRKVRMGLRQINWLIGKIEGIIKKYPIGGPEPLRDYTRAVQRFTTKTFMCWKCLIVAMEEEMDKNEVKFNKERRAEMYGKLGLEAHLKFFGNGLDEIERERKWKLQRKELGELLKDADNDVMVTYLAYDGHGRAKVAGYSVKETFDNMKMRGG